MAGTPFQARYAIAGSTSRSTRWRCPLPEAGRLQQGHFATPPFVAVTVETQGAPILIGRPSLQNGHASVQAEFHPTTTGSKYFALQPGALDRVHPRRSSSEQPVARNPDGEAADLRGQPFSYTGTFAARGAGTTDSEAPAGEDRLVGDAQDGDPRPREDRVGRDQPHRLRDPDRRPERAGHPESGERREVPHHGSCEAAQVPLRIRGCGRTAPGTPRPSCTGSARRRPRGRRP